MKISNKLYVLIDSMCTVQLRWSLSLLFPEVSKPEEMEIERIHAECLRLHWREGRSHKRSLRALRSEFHINIQDFIDPSKRMIYLWFGSAALTKWDFRLFPCTHTHAHTRAPFWVQQFWREHTERVWLWRRQMCRCLGGCRKCGR